MAEAAAAAGHATSATAGAGAAADSNGAERTLAADIAAAPELFASSGKPAAPVQPGAAASGPADPVKADGAPAAAATPVTNGELQAVLMLSRQPLHLECTQPMCVCAVRHMTHMRDSNPDAAAVLAELMASSRGDHVVLLLGICVGPSQPMLARLRMTHSLAEALQAMMGTR